ncbi:MAG: LysM peptidoglycan-binding domain-containing protein [Aquabacterium sp.]
MVQAADGYVVRRGDTLAKIANENGTTVEALTRYNHIKDPNRITIGQVVRFEPKISVQVLDRLHQPIPDMKLQLFVSGRYFKDAVSCADGWVRDIVLPTFSDVLQVFVSKPTGEKKKIASIKPSGEPKSVQLVSPKVKVAAVSAKMQGGVPQAQSKSKATTASAGTTKNGTPAVVVSTPPVSGKEKSGLAWVNRFPTSTSLDDLKEPFKTSAKDFVGALRSAGVTVRVNATYRPTERSYLMYYSAAISRGELCPTKVPAWPGVNIDWAHLGADGKADLTSAKAAAKAMKNAYAIGANPVGRPGRSNHNKRLAMDISVNGYQKKTTIDGDGNSKELKKWSDLEDLGKSYEVYWFGSDDRPHWSVDGN